MTKLSIYINQLLNVIVTGTNNLLIYESNVIDILKFNTLLFSISLFSWVFKLYHFVNPLSCGIAEILLIVLYKDYLMIKFKGGDNIWD